MEVPKCNTAIVCIRNPAHGARLLTEAARAAGQDARLLILSVQPVEQSDAEKSRFVEEVYRLSREFGAEMNVIFSDNPVLTAARFVQCAGPAVLFTGMPADEPQSFVTLLRQLLPQTMISMVSEEAITYRLYPSSLPAVRRKLAGAMG